MALVQAVIAALARSLRALLNTTFGWATVLLFGKLPEDRQPYLSLVAFGAVSWLVALLGLVFPAFTASLPPLVTVPASADTTGIRLAMLAAVLLLPPIEGLMATRMLDPADRPEGADARAVLKGYPYTLGLALTFLMLTVFALLLKLHTLIRRWTTQHMAIIVEGQDYLPVVGEIQQALKAGGWEAERQQAPWLLRFPTQVLTLFAGEAVERLVPKHLTTLRAPTLAVTLHPADLVTSGTAADVTRARATLAQQLAYSRAYLTWTKEANELEDRLHGLWRELQAGAAGVHAGEVASRFHAIAQDLHEVQIPYEEWETLFREKLLVERGLLLVAAGRADRPKDLTEAPQEQTGRAQPREAT